MRRLFLGAAVAAALAFPAAAADQRDFTVVNETGYEIAFIGVNPPGDNDFGENELSHPLADKQSIDVKFGNADKGCSWNLKVKWTGYQEQVFFQGLDLCKIEKATLRYDRANNKTTAIVQ